MNLQQEIDAGRAEIRTTGYTMSVGELISLYERNEIDLHPQFQQFFHWDIWRKSRLIESLLLGIPVPAIFVFQRDDGVWDVIDGLQRLSTIFQFVGILRKEDNTLEPPLVLEETEYLPSLKGVIWKDDEFLEQQALTSAQASLTENEHSQPKTLTSAQRLLIIRAKIHVGIILRGDDETGKYDFLQRLNTSGLSLSSQEIRNCILVSLNRDMHEWIKMLAHDGNFTSCLNLTDRSISQQYDHELVLRFLIFRNLDAAALQNIGDSDNFLMKKMRELATSKDFDKEKEEKYFKETFELLASTTKENSFRKYNFVRGKFVGGFLIPAYETIALGIGYHIDHLNGLEMNIEEKVKQLWRMQEFIENADSSRAASSRIPRVVPLGRRLFI